MKIDRYQNPHSVPDPVAGKRRYLQNDGRGDLVFIMFSLLGSGRSPFHSFATQTSSLLALINSALPLSPPLLKTKTRLSYLTIKNYYSQSNAIHNSEMIFSFTIRFYIIYTDISFGRKIIYVMLFCFSEKIASKSCYRWG